MMVIDTVQEIAPGVIEVDEYVVQSESGGMQHNPGSGSQRGGGE